ncbi:hypothetical protein D3C87_598480 [compost metagenome]|jgi:hypothetical protein
MGDLKLIVPVANARPDFTVRSDTHTLSLQASFWFKVRAGVSKDWAIAQLKEYARKEHGVNPESIYSIMANGRYPIYTK